MNSTNITATATATEFNRQGRHVSERMRLEAFKCYLATQPKIENLRSERYRSFTIEQRPKGKGWALRYENGSLFPESFSSLSKTRAAVDACIEVRAIAATEVSR